MSGQGDHFVRTNFWFASHFDRTCTLLMDMNLFIFLLQYIIHLMSDPEGNSSYFRFPESPGVFRDEVEGSFFNPSNNYVLVIR